MWVEKLVGKPAVAFFTEDPGVLRLTKEGVSASDEGVCHAVTSSTERQR